MACLAPLMGDRSAGDALVKSTAPTGSLPAGAYAFPKLGTQVDFTRPFRAATTTPTTLTDAGVSVPISSVLGGAGNNLPADTPLLWFPSNEGVETISAVGASAMTGGTAETSPFAVKSIVWFEEPAASQLADDLIRSAIRTSPAIVLSWSRRLPITKMHGQKVGVRVDQWQALVVCSRQESHHTRGLQALTIVDLVEAELLDRTSVDGIVVSNPAIQIMGVQRVAVNPSFYAYALTLQTSVSAVGTDDTKRGLYSAWQKTKFTMPAEGDPTLDVVHDATYVQP